MEEDRGFWVFTDMATQIHALEVDVKRRLGGRGEQANGLHHLGYRLRGGDQTEGDFLGSHGR
jgi:hypothetical protein